VERRARRSKQQRVSLVARHGPTSPRERLASTPGDPARVGSRRRTRRIGRSDAARRVGVLEERSLSHWLASAPHPVIGLVTAEAVNWATQLQEIAEWLDATWEVPTSDAYYDVASARTTLRAVETSSCEPVNLGPSFAFVVDHRARVPDRGCAPISRLRPGRPRRRSSGALHRPMAEAGVCLSVDGTMSDLRSGARDLVRTPSPSDVEGPSWPPRF